MTITHAKWEKPLLVVDGDGKAILDPEGNEQFISTITAGPIEGQTWSGITPASRFWPIVQEWVDAGNVIEPHITPGPSSADVNRERDRRIDTGTAVQITGYGPVPLQGREKDQTNLLGLQAAAALRIAAGDVATLTKFRDAANVDHMLTPPQIIELWSKGAAWISDTYDASWAIKALDPIPADYADDSWWP